MKERQHPSNRYNQTQPDLNREDRADIRPMKKNSTFISHKFLFLANGALSLYVHILDTKPKIEWHFTEGMFDKC